MALLGQSQNWAFCFSRSLPANFIACSAWLCPATKLWRGKRPRLRKYLQIKNKKFLIRGSSAILDTKSIVIRKPKFFCVKDTKPLPRSASKPKTAGGGRGWGHARPIKKPKKFSKNQNIESQISFTSSKSSGLLKSAGNIFSAGFPNK